MLRVLDLFSGIGGFSLGLERTGGFETVAFCEIEPFCRDELKERWPHVPRYADVRELTADRLRADGISVDAICGGFPCQDLSRAGGRRGLDGERSGLWAEFRRLIRDLRPAYVLVENVPDLLSGPAEQPGAWFGRLLGDLAELGFDAEWHRIPAAAVGAPQLRDRVWVVAYPNQDDDGGAPHAGAVRRRAGAGADQAARPDGQRHRRGSGDCGQAPLAWHIARQPRTEWKAEPDVGRLVDGLPDDLVQWRQSAREALGNAVVPAIPELIGRAILASREHQAEAA